MNQPIDLIIAQFLENKKQEIIAQIEREKERNEKNLWYSWGSKIMNRYEGS